MNAGRSIADPLMHTAKYPNGIFSLCAGLTWEHEVEGKPHAAFRLYA